ncbi:MAG: putative DNA binding domain-containing protein [Xanthobacteraceae bacterium]|nr:putative DNA binding domain-containing protein [Xanthobacteraceae bacterium]
MVECFEGNIIDPFEIAMQSGREQSAIVELAKRLNQNLNALRAIKDVSLPVQVVPHHAPLEEAIDIFDRINSQGTKLTDAELALTHVTAKWPHARRVLKEKMEFCAAQKFEFNLTFMTRALVTAVTGRALYEPIHPRPLGDLQAGWKTLNGVLDHLMTVLPKAANIHSTEDLNTTNALIPMIAYLARNKGIFLNQKATQHAVNWLYAALMWARYTAQTDQRLEADLSIVAKDVEPWAALRANIVEQRGRIEVKPDDFQGRTAQHPLYRMLFILAKAHGAVDWFNGVPLGNTVGASYAVHSHHIFPQSLLYRSGFDADNYMHRQMVNEIANRAFLTAASNVPLSDTEPAEYLPTIESKYPGALARQFIPMDPELWKVSRYADFLSARRELLAKKLNEYMAALIAEPEEIKHRPIAELVKLGESAVLEFKSTLQWDVVLKQLNKGLRKSCLKTIAAFMNSEGGTLLIGVEDDGSILGLDKDLGLMARKINSSKRWSI